ncbi:hypothetical protein [Microvirga sp. G4-2]|uniref:hypothetical protein n=1 Tax=Microvirga sp. G4-2 TaxID=3434467 RepID=UPI004044D828
MSASTEGESDDQGHHGASRGSPEDEIRLEHGVFGGATLDMLTAAESPILVAH